MKKKKEEIKREYKLSKIVYNPYSIEVLIEGESVEIGDICFVCEHKEETIKLDRDTKAGYNLYCSNCKVKFIFRLPQAYKGEKYYERNYEK